VNRAVTWIAAAGAAAAFAAWRRRSERQAHADLYFDDGSMVSLSAEDDDADRMLAIAEDLVAAARRASAAGS
jgi:hypothetical protein